MQKITTAVLLIIFFCSCSTTKDKYSGQDTNLQFPYYPEQEQSERSTNAASKVYPWEIWTPGKDLEGLPLTNSAILQGDKLAVKGQRAKALETYLAIDRRGLFIQEQESLVLRTASTQLSLGKSKDALATISDFFTKNDDAVNKVSGQFAIVLAFAYGQNRETEQSLAWFSRAHSLSSRSRTFDMIAVSGVKTFLQRVPDEQLDRMSGQWAKDAFIRQLIAEERVLRSQRGTPVETDPYALGNENQFSAPTVAGVPVAVMLPLSGKYSSLGQNTNKGLELVLSGASIEGAHGIQQVNLVTKDITDTTAAINQFNQLVTNERPAVIVGPLLTEPAVAVSEIAKHSHVPMLTFSKKDDFPSGGGVFRLGVTASSQVETLLRYAYNTLNISRIAIVYPSDANGREFADALRKLLARRGVAVVFERVYNKEDLSALLPIAQELEQSSAQAVFFPDNILTASRFFTNLNPAYRERIKILGTASWEDLSQLSRFQTVLDGAIIVSPFFSRSQRPLVQKFVETYRARYGQEPDFLAAQGYDAGTIVLAALRKALADDQNISQAMSDLTQYEGLTGTVSSGSDGDLQRQYTLVEFKNGSLLEVNASQSPPEFVYKGNNLVAPVGAAR